MFLSCRADRPPGVFVIAVPVIGTDVLTGRGRGIIHDSPARSQNVGSLGFESDPLRRRRRSQSVQENVVDVQDAGFAAFDANAQLGDIPKVRAG